MASISLTRRRNGVRFSGRGPWWLEQKAERAACEAVKAGALPVGHPIYAAEHGGSAAPSYGAGREFEPRRCNANCAPYFDAGTSLGRLTGLISRGIGEFESPSRYFRAGVRRV